jgi:ATP-binding cassette subfamily B protein
MHPDYGYFEESKLGKPYDVQLLRRLLPYTRPYRRLLIGSIGLVVLITALELALPYITKIAIDRYIVPRQEISQSDNTSATNDAERYLHISLSDPRVAAIAERYPGLITVEAGEAKIAYSNLAQVDPPDLRILRQGDIDGLAMLTGLFLALVLLNFVFNFFQKLVMETTGHRMMHDLRMHLFEHTTDLAIDFYTRNPVGRLVTRVTNDVQNMNELFTSVISFVFKDLFLLAGIAVVMLLLNWQLALVSFTVLPLVVFASMRFSKLARDIFRELRVLVAEINTRFAETIGGIRVLQLFRQEAANYHSFEALNHRNYLAGMRQIHVLAVFLPLINVISLVATALIVFYGGTGVLKNTLSLGALVAFISYIRMLFRPLRDLAEKYNILQNAMASAERIFLILDTDTKLPLPKASRQLTTLEQIEDIRLENIRFGYTAGEDVLKDVSVRIRRGQTVAVVGPTGAGKTSLLNLIPRFYDPQSGRVRINGRDLIGYAPRTYRSKMALVMQDPFLFSGTVRENIFEGQPDVDPRQVDRIVSAAHLQGLLSKLPEGLESRLSEGGASISSGERQLISIARAFARNPQLILFDEATSYIDSQTELMIQQALSELMQDRTALVIAHRLSTVRQADNILVLNRGRIIEAGTHAELIAARGFYYHLYQLENTAPAAP